MDCIPLAKLSCLRVCTEMVKLHHPVRIAQNCIQVNFGFSSSDKIHRLDFLFALWLQQ